jgi:hypothetical protein
MAAFNPLRHFDRRNGAHYELITDWWNCPSREGVFLALVGASQNMDEIQARRRFAKAEAVISYETEQIEKQRAHIQRLRNEGHKTEQAEGVLGAFEHSLAGMKHHRDILLEQLGRYEAGEAGTNTKSIW